MNEKKSAIVYSAGDGLWKWLDYPLVQTHNLINTCTQAHSHTHTHTDRGTTRIQGTAHA